MKYGLIGEKLGHSFSKEIHKRLGDYSYELCELRRDELQAFFEKRDFDGINVTIPYKSEVIPYLDEIDEAAAKIGAVNTVVNRGGRLIGYNTDVFGMLALAAHAGISLAGRKVAVLGTGGTSKTAVAAATASGAREIICVSRTPSGGDVGYDELYRAHGDAEVIINTTPVGMYPASEGCPVIIDRLPCLLGVIDAVYNPLRTALVLSARERGIAAEGGLYMLVAQGVRASELFFGKSYPQETVERVYREISREKENIVLIGMPSSGKTSVGEYVAKALCRELIDTDREIVRTAGRDIPDIFSELGEEGFRDAESAAIKEAASLGGRVIATGGGAVLREENLAALRKTGKIYFIDRPLGMLIPTSDRPLSKTREDIEKRYRERYPIYTKAADVHIDGSGSVAEVGEKIIKEFCK